MIFLGNRVDHANPPPRGMGKRLRLSQPVPLGYMPKDGQNFTAGFHPCLFCSDSPCPFRFPS